MALLTLSLFSIVPGWLLINAGLTDNVGKYGLNFSGVDFLLGPDRSHLLSTMELFIRWALVQLLATIGLAFGAMLYLKWSRELVDSKHRGTAKKANVSGSVLSELRVPLELNQVKFLNELAVQMGEDLSTTIGLIISFLKKEMEHSMETKKLIYDAIKRYAGHKENKISGRRVLLKLPSAQIKTISEIQLSAEVGSLDVIGGLVAVFMETSQWDSRN